MRTAAIGLTAVLSASVWMGGPASASPPGATTASRWGSAQEVPGTAALNTGGNADIASVSYASPGNCSAGGYYYSGSAHLQAFVASQSGGTWGTAIEVPGIAALNTDGDAEVTSVSCASPGNCSAGGSYVDGSGGGQAFVVGQSGGTWGTAIQVPGSAVLNIGGTAQITSVSCASAGNCTAGGSYTDGSGHRQVFVASTT
jgi:hypothetical protein